MAKQVPLDDWGFCYHCWYSDGKVTKGNLTMVTYCVVKPTEANDYRRKGADLCNKHSRAETKRYNKESGY